MYAGTGHRPPKLGLDYSKASDDLLRNFVVEELKKLPGVTTIISGMATGYDQALAEAALVLGIPLWAVPAFQGMEAKWPKSGQKRYRDILLRADQVDYPSLPGYAPNKFAVRDRFMVDNCSSLLALFDENEQVSGTGITVGYARKIGIPVLNLWPAWQGCIAFRATHGSDEANA